MSNNWAKTPNIAMDNPLGGIMRGWENIRALYERIFNGRAKVYVEYYDYTTHEVGDTFYTVGRERGYFEVDDQKHSEHNLWVKLLRAVKKRKSIRAKHV